MTEIKTEKIGKKRHPDPDPGPAFWLLPKFVVYGTAFMRRAELQSRKRSSRFFAVGRFHNKPVNVVIVECSSVKLFESTIFF